MGPGIPNNFTIPDEIPKDFVIPPNFTIPPNLNLPSGLTADMDEFVSLYTEMSKSLQTYSSETNGYLETIDDYVEAIKSAISITSTINTSMESVSVWFNSSLSFVGIVCFLTLIFMIRVVVSPKKRPEIDEDDNDEFNDDTGSSSSNSKFSCWINFQTYVLIPLYFICMLLLLIFTCGFAIAVVANADFCSGSPENNIMAVAEKFELKENDEEIYKVMEYYIKGCTTNNVNAYYQERSEDNPFGYLDDVKLTLEDAVGVVHSFQSYEDFNEESIKFLCPNGNTWDSFTSLNNTATELERLLTSTNDKIGLVIKSISCQVYTPIYIQYMHQGLCTDASDNIMVLFFSAMFVTIFVMIMLTLRVALLSEPIDEAASLRRNEDEEVSLIRDGNDSARGHRNSESTLLGYSNDSSRRGFDEYNDDNSIADESMP